jgi:hypothetical protein
MSKMLLAVSLEQYTYHQILQRRSRNNIIEILDMPGLVIWLIWWLAFGC